MKNRRRLIRTSPLFWFNEKKKVAAMPYMKIFPQQRSQGKIAPWKKNRESEKTQFFHMLAAPLQIPN